MKLSTFVAETIKQIMDGVVDAQDHAEKHGAVVNPARQEMNLATRDTKETDRPQRRQDIDFDVAVTVEEQSSKKGGAGIFVAPFGLGAQKQNVGSAQTVSRVSFSVPIHLPVQQRK